MTAQIIQLYNENKHYQQCAHSKTNDSCIKHKKIDKESVFNTSSMRIRHTSWSLLFVVSGLYLARAQKVFKASFFSSCMNMTKVINSTTGRKQITLLSLKVKYN